MPKEKSNPPFLLCKYLGRSHLLMESSKSFYSSLFKYSGNVPARLIQTPRCPKPQGDLPSATQKPPADCSIRKKNIVRISDVSVVEHVFTITWAIPVSHSFISFDYYFCRIRKEFGSENDTREVRTGM
ncbi:hypothetical protein AVEN_7393-1 [Araneus ventricosus]|uniref:Uncharacterized protein n=1 Tax=Araneus ventricosus TaxID=182803 RepID=A0A4Y2BRY5_ARAVE|nr:hypothetical protein AVEN_7393-1 [Araneus ventricosus]